MTGQHGWARHRRWLVSGLAGLSIGWLIGGWFGVICGPVAALTIHRVLGRIEPAHERRRRLQAAADLPYTADLLAAVRGAGLPTDRAARIVADAVGGPVGDLLGRVARSLALGVEPIRAWAALDGVPGGERLSAAVARSADSGAALAGAFTRLAEDLRAARAASAEAVARRAGVLIVLPLGLCFLPAFVFAGIVPVIVAVLGDVL